MHGKGAHGASRRTAPSESTSLHSSALVRLGGFLAFFSGLCAKVENFPEPNRFRPVSPPGPCKVMHAQGAYEASRRTAPSESTSIHSSALGRPGDFWAFFLFLPGPGPFIGFFHRVSKFQPRGRATICVVRHHTEPRVAPPRNPNVLYFRRRSPRLSLFL